MAPSCEPSRAEMSELGAEPSRVSRETDQGLRTGWGYGQSGGAYAHRPADGLRPVTDGHRESSWRGVRRQVDAHLGSK